MRSPVALLRRWYWGQRRLDAAFRRPFARVLLWRLLGRGSVPPLDSTPVSRVIFVCHGNIMRSAFAGAWWQASRERGARRIPACSAGGDARAGRAAHPDAIRAAAAIGLSLEAHAATPLSQVMPMPGDLFVAFDCENEVVIRRHVSERPDVRVLLLGDLETPGTLDAEIRDPYGAGPGAAEETFRRIGRLLDRLQRALTV